MFISVLILLLIAVVILPIVLWYFFSLPLVKGGMVYGRNTLLYMLVLLWFRSMDDHFTAKAEQIALYVLLFVACCDALYALLRQWEKVAGVVRKIYNLVADYAAFVCMLLAYPAFRLTDMLYYSDKPLMALFYAANVASVVHNIRLVRKGDYAAIGMILLSAAIMMILIVMDAFDPFTLPLS